MRAIPTLTLGFAGSLLATPSVFAGTQVFTDRSEWTAATTTLDFEEDFSGFLTEPEFRTAPLNANGFSIEQVGVDAMFRNFVEQSPFEFFDNNGTAHASCFVNLDPPAGNTTLRLTPSTSVLAFGADFNGAGGNELVRIVLNRVDGTQDIFDPAFTQTGIDEFWGFVASLDEAVTSIEFEARILLSAVGGEGFGLDNVGGTFAPQTVVIDFETEDDFATPLENGQAITAGSTFGTLVRIDGASDSGFTAATFDSDPAGPNAESQDPDLLVGLGNVLILQSDGAQSVPGTYDTPGDDANGGTFEIELLAALQPVSIDLIDLCPSGDQSALVKLVDGAGQCRIYEVPAGFTEDITVSGGLGYRTLDLTTLAPQVGFESTATASEDPEFESGAVVRIQVLFGGSAALDNLVLEGSTAATTTTGLNCFLVLGSARGTDVFSTEGFVFDTQLEGIFASYAVGQGAVPAFQLDPSLLPRVATTTPRSSGGGSANIELPSALPSFTAQLVATDASRTPSVVRSSNLIRATLLPNGDVRWHSIGSAFGIVATLETTRVAAENHGSEGPKTTAGTRFSFPFQLVD